jgi:hypothetical protein
MPVRMKHPMAIEAEARKIEARNGGSITKKRMKPATTATTLAIIAKTMLTVRSWVIARLQIALTPRCTRVYAVSAPVLDRLGVSN